MSSLITFNICVLDSGSGGLGLNHGWSHLSSGARLFKCLSPPFLQHHPSPNFKDEKMTRFWFSTSSSMIWGRGGFISYLIVTIIAACERRRTSSCRLCFFYIIFFSGAWNERKNPGKSTMRLTLREVLCDAWRLYPICCWWSNVQFLFRELCSFQVLFFDEQSIDRFLFLL